MSLLMKRGKYVVFVRQRGYICITVNDGYINSKLKTEGVYVSLSPKKKQKLETGKFCSKTRKKR